jgi:hypothetical protein
VSTNHNAVAAEQFGIRVREHARSMVENRRAIFERFTILLAINLITGGAYSRGTPIDTGFAQNGWAVGINGPPKFRQASHPSLEFASAGTGRSRSTSTGRFANPAAVNVVSLVEIIDALRGVPLGATVQFANNCVYIRPLEFGHSQQAPAGFMRITAAAAPRIAHDAAAQTKGADAAARALGAARNG